MVLGLVLVCCVMAMHGFQASNRPTDVSRLPIAMAGHVETGAAGPGHAPSPSDGPHDSDQHSGGQACLALLALAAFAALLLLASYRRTPVLPARRSFPRPRPPDAGRSPPSVPMIRSVVLRL